VTGKFSTSVMFQKVIRFQYQADAKSVFIVGSLKLSSPLFIRFSFSKKEIFKSEKYCMLSELHNFYVNEKHDSKSTNNYRMFKMAINLYIKM
jgi:hypothetical protein